MEAVGFVDTVAAALADTVAAGVVDAETTADEDALRAVSELVGVVDGFALKAGDIVVELATRVDTVTMWAEVKSRGAHFLNTGASAEMRAAAAAAAVTIAAATHVHAAALAPFFLLQPLQALTCGRTWSWT
jgi:hypothetical protein